MSEVCLKVGNMILSVNKGVSQWGTSSFKMAAKDLVSKRKVRSRGIWSSTGLSRM